MGDKNQGLELLNTIKVVVDNYTKNYRPAAILLGTYDGIAVHIGSLPVPLNMITGNGKEMLKPGDQLRLLRNAGGKEYSIIEILGVLYQTGDAERSPLAARIEQCEEKLGRIDTEAIGQLTEQMGGMTDQISDIQNRITAVENSINNLTIDEISDDFIGSLE